MEINKLIEIVKRKIKKEISLQEINVEDKSFLHKDHKNNSPNKFHIKISIISDELKNKKKIVLPTKILSWFMPGHVRFNKLIYLIISHVCKVIPIFVKFSDML